MRLVADLHVHSRYSRATSREADLAAITAGHGSRASTWSGPGTSPTPKWVAELASLLVEKDGLFVLKDPPARVRRWTAPSPADREVRFVLTTEISSIYKKHGLVRKVHSLLVVPHAGRGAGGSPRGWPPSATSPRTAGRSWASTRRTCCPSSWKPPRTAFSFPPTSGRRGFPCSAPSRASTGSRTASRTSRRTSSRWRPASPRTRP